MFFCHQQVYKNLEEEIIKVKYIYSNFEVDSLLIKILAKQVHWNI